MLDAGVGVSRRALYCGLDGSLYGPGVGDGGVEPRAAGARERGADGVLHQRVNEAERTVGSLEDEAGGDRLVDSVGGRLVIAERAGDELELKVAADESGELEGRVSGTPDRPVVELTREAAHAFLRATPADQLWREDQAIVLQKLGQ